MAVISVRVTKKEKEMIDFLTLQLKQDKSSLIKNALKEKYEDLKDLEYIEKFEDKQKKNKIKFISAEQALKDLTKK